MYTQGDFETMNGKELDQVKGQFEQVGIAPNGWAKMKVSEKMKWLVDNLASFRKVLQPAELPAHVREKKAWDARKAEYLKLRARHGSLVNCKRAIQHLSAQHEAPDPEPLTRQVRRQNERHGARVQLSSAKARAKKNGDWGGAAAVRSV